MARGPPVVLRVDWVAKRLHRREVRPKGLIIEPKISFIDLDPLFFFDFKNYNFQRTTSLNTHILIYFKF